MSASLKTLEESRVRVSVANRFLCWALPFAALGVISTVVRVGMDSRRPIAPSRPSLREFQRPVVAIPALEWAAASFSSAGPTGSEGRPNAEVATQKGEWKLVGVALEGTSKRALLQDAEGQQTVWVLEDESLGVFRVKEIRERSVVLEKEGKLYEIRM